MAAGLLPHLIDDELGVSPNVEAFDAELDGDAEAAEEGLVFRHVVDTGKCKRTTYRMCFPRGETNSRPAPAPVFITDPSKYMSQHSA